MNFNSTRTKYLCLIAADFLIPTWIPCFVHFAINKEQIPFREEYDKGNNYKREEEGIPVT